MENFYTIQEITEKIGISVSTFYQEKKKNAVFFDANTIKHREEEQSKKRKPINKYSQSVFDFFANKYGQEGSVSVLEDASSTTNASDKAHAETHTRPQGRTQEAGEGESLDNSAQAKIEALQAEIEALKAQLEKAEGEKEEAQKQLGIALLCLQQEKAEKQLLLPGPKKSIGARIKGLFKKTD